LSLSVVVVEDSKEILSVIQDLLHHIGGFKVAAHLQTESEATGWIEQPSPHWDVAMLDLVLREGSGFNLIRRFKSAHPAGRIIVLSDYATPIIKVRCVELGADAVFSKGEVKDFSGYLAKVQDRLSGAPA
jgi:two-component system OmpR family response regulator